MSWKMIAGIAIVCQLLASTAGAQSHTWLQQNSDMGVALQCTITVHPSVGPACQLPAITGSVEYLEEPSWNAIFLGEIGPTSYNLHLRLVGTSVHAPYAARNAMSFLNLCPGVPQAIYGDIGLAWQAFRDRGSKCVPQEN